MTEILIIAVSIIAGLVIIGLILTRLYKRSTKETSFVRTGFGGQKVIMDGGALVLPVLHEVIPVNMNTLRLEVIRAQGDGLITKDRIRVDVTAEFYVRVQPNEGAIAKAAQTLGRKTMSPEELKSLVNGKFVDSLRAVAAEMDMTELHEKRVDFVQKVQQSVSEDLFKNGLELESVSLTGLDQTDVKYLNANNAFDAEGLTKLTQTIEHKRKERNDIEQQTNVAISQRNLEAERETLTIKRETEYATLEAEREIAIRKAKQSADIAAEESAKQREAEEAKIANEREVQLKKIAAERDIENENISKAKAIETSKIEQTKVVELAEQDRAIAIAEKSRAQSEAAAAADEARVAAVKAEESVVTARETEIANRDKQIVIIEAEKQAQRDAVAIRVQAEAEKQAAENIAAAKRLAAQGDKDADILRAEGRAKQYAVDAEGQKQVNEAKNTLNAELIAMDIRLALINNMPEIIAQSVKPLEQIDSIKILQMNGQGLGATGAGNIIGNGQPTNLPEQVVNSALQYRAGSKLVDHLLGELGLQGGSLNGLTGALINQPVEAANNPTVQDLPSTDVNPNQGVLNLLENDTMNNGASETTGA